MKKIVVLLVFLIFFAACASVSMQSEKVRVTSRPDMVEGCEYIGPVGSSSILVDIRANGVAFNNALHDMKGEAKEVGANMVFISTQAITSGDAYKCN